MSVRNVSVFYWGDAGALSVEIYSQSGAETAVTVETQSYGGVYRRIYAYAGFSTGLLRLNLTGTETALLTEIQVLDSVGGSLLGQAIDTSLFDTVATTATTTATTESIVSPISVQSTLPASSPAVPSQSTEPTSVTSLNATTPSASAPVNAALIGGILVILAIGLVLLLIAVLLPLFLFVRRRRGRGKEGYSPAKKDSRSATRQMSQSNEMGLYEPITKQNQNDPYYEDPDSLGRGREEKGYSQLIEDDSNGAPPQAGKNGPVSMANQWYEGGDDYNIYARPEVSAVIFHYPC